MADDKTPDSGSADGAAINQSDVDALFAGGGGADGAPENVQGDAPPSDVGDTAQAPGASRGEGAGDRGGRSVSPADINALLGASQDGVAGMNAIEDASAETQAEADFASPPEDFTHTAPPSSTQAGTRDSTAAAPSFTTEPVDLPDLTSSSGLPIDTKKVTMLNDVKLRVKLQLGKTKMLVEDVLSLGEGSVVELDKLAGDPIDVLVNDRLIARGEVLVLNDSFCVRISEVLTNDPHRITT